MLSSSPGTAQLLKYRYRRRHIVRLQLPCLAGLYTLLQLQQLFPTYLLYLDTYSPSSSQLWTDTLRDVLIHCCINPGVKLRNRFSPSLHTIWVVRHMDAFLLQCGLLTPTLEQPNTPYILSLCRSLVAPGTSLLWKLWLCYKALSGVGFVLSKVSFLTA